MKKYITYLILGLSLILLPAIDTEAKTSSSRSFSSRSSSSVKPSSSGFSSSRKPSAVKPSSSGFSSSSSSKPSAVKPSTGGFSSSSSKPNSSGSVSSPKPKNAFEISQQRKAITPPPPKDKFVSDFKQKNASKYPTTFNTQPTSRPNYIPPSTNYNGRNRDVQYNPQTRSYGFFDDFGKFMVYDAITDLALGQFKTQEKVYIQTTEQLKKEEEIAKVNEENENTILGIIAVLSTFGVIFAVGYFIYKS